MEREAEKKSLKRYSLENWDIINSLKQQKKELEEFEDQYVKSSFEITGNESDCFQGLFNRSSPGSCKYSSFCTEVSSISKYESCLEGQALSSPSKKTQGIKESAGKLVKKCDSEKVEDVDGPSRGEAKEKESLGVDSGAEISKSMRNLMLKLEELRDVESDKKLQIQNALKFNSDAKVCLEADGVNKPSHSQTSAAIHCLLSIRPLKKYFSGITLNHSSNNEVTKVRDSILQYFMRIFKLRGKLENSSESSELQTLIDASKNTEVQETCFEALKRILSNLHEEIIMAKKIGNLKRPCLRRCRQAARANHSIISHLFRGHLKQRAQCPCGHVNIKHEPFTSLPLSFSNLDTKTIVIPLTSCTADGESVVQKFLLCFNQWTTIANLQSKLYHLNSQCNSKITIASVQRNNITLVHEASSSIFDAICKEGELQAFVTYRLTNKEGEGYEMEYPYTSTPAVTDISDLEEQGRRSNAKKHACNKQAKSEYLSVPVVFKGHSYLTDHQINCAPKFVQLPKLTDGKMVSQVCSRLLSVSENGASKIFISIKNMQNEQCLLCSDVTCFGCHLKASRTIALGTTYKIVVYITPSIQAKAAKIVEHSTLVSGTPTNILSIEEGLATFRKQESLFACSACGVEQKLEVTRSVITYPNVLVIKVKSANVQNTSLTYPHTGFAPDLSKAVKNRKTYNLSATISAMEGCNSSMATEYSFSSPSILKKTNEPGDFCTTLSDKIEILVYSSTQTSDKKRSKKASYHHIPKKAHKKKRQPSAATLAKEISIKDIDALGNDRGPSSEAAAPLLPGKNVSRQTTRDDDTASVCNCSRCRCLQKCAAQIRGSASTTIENIKLDEAQLSKLKESVHTGPSPTAQLHRAILKQDLRRAVSLLKRGADPNELLDGIAAIHLAAGLQLPMGYFFTKLLVDHGADANIKTSDGVTPVQLASMWRRSETLRFLSYHGGDLSSTTDILELPRKTKSMLSSAYSQTSCTPNASPAKRYDGSLHSPHYSEADLRLKNIIQLQRSLHESHHVLQDATGPADDFAHLKMRSLGMMQELIDRGQQTDENATDDEENGNAVNSGPSLVNNWNSEQTSRLTLSDFSIRNREGSVIPEEDEVDFPVDVSGSIVPQVPDSVNGNSVTSLASSSLKAENNINIDYMPKSHINTRHRGLSYYLCCGYRRHTRQKNSTGAFAVMRGYCRRRLQAFVEFVGAIGR